MTQHNSKPRLYVRHDLTLGGVVPLSSDQSHYLGRVMRLGVDDEITLFNGRHGEWSAKIENMAKKSCTLKLTGQFRTQSTGTDLWLAFAPLKKSRTDFLVEKATELGVTRLLPVFTLHTDTGRVNTERLAKVCTKAAEQTERLSIPEISTPQQLADLVANWPKNRLLLVADETGSGQPIAQVLGSLKNDGAPSLALLIGPEGGFSPVEIETLHKLPFSLFMGLGPRILRAETAALAAMACIQSIIGDGNTPPRPVTRKDQ